MTTAGIPAHRGSPYGGAYIHTPNRPGVPGSFWNTETETDNCPDPKQTWPWPEQTILETDTSDLGIGAVLSQLLKGQERTCSLCKPVPKPSR